MHFERNEFAAIVKLAMAMTAADGVFVENEKKAISLELIRFGVSKSELPSLLADARSMASIDSVNTVAKFSDEQKKYVAAFLGELMVVDGTIAPAEMKLWRLTIQICGLPEITVDEAIDYMTNL